MKQPHMASSSCAAEADVKKKGYLLKVKVNVNVAFCNDVNKNWESEDKGK